jgi:hypothetical protein
MMWRFVNSKECVDPALRSSFSPVKELASQEGIDPEEGLSATPPWKLGASCAELLSADLGSLCDARSLARKCPWKRFSLGNKVKGVARARPRPKEGRNPFRTLSDTWFANICEISARA